MSIRKPARAGSFYPRFKPELIEIIKESFLDEKFGEAELKYEPK